MDDPKALPFDPEAVAELVQRAKRELRKSAKKMRLGIPRGALATRGAALVERLREELGDARRVALFHPIEAQREVDLRALDPAIRAAGGLVAYPAFLEDRTMVFRDPGSLEALVDRGSGFLEPPPDAERVEELDVIVVPALLVDANGHRLGYGGGFYDRTLPRFCPPARAVAAVFDFQLAADLPSTTTDVRVNAVVTDRKVLRFDDARAP
jgi:5-formyltetrahydrofolate cyclo-ligase